MAVNHSTFEVADAVKRRAIFARPLRCVWPVDQLSYLRMTRRLSNGGKHDGLRACLDRSTPEAQCYRLGRRLGGSCQSLRIARLDFGTQGRALAEADRRALMRGRAA